MAEEKKEKYVPYSERLGEAIEEERKELFKTKLKPKLNLTDEQQEFAKAFLRLSQNDDFKTYLKFENFEISNRLIEAFANDSKDATMSFGEKMAFNKGRHMQMVYLKNSREMIMKLYVSMLKQEEKIKEESNGSR